MKQMYLHSWKWRTEIQMCYFTPQLTDKNILGEVQFDSPTSWLVHSFPYSVIPPLPFLCCTWSNWRMWPCLSCTIIIFTKWPLIYLIDFNEKWSGEKTVSGKRPISSTLIQLLFLYVIKLFCSHCLINDNNSNNNKILCILYLIREFRHISFIIVKLRTIL